MYVCMNVCMYTIYESYSRGKGLVHQLKDARPLVHATVEATLCHQDQGMNTDHVQNEDVAWPTGEGSYLVGGFNPSEKYSSIGMIIPNILANTKMFHTTNQLPTGNFT